MVRLFFKKVFRQNLVLRVVILLLSIIFILLILLLIFPKFNMFVVQYSDAEKILIPEVGAGKEIEYYGYKYSNSSGIIVSAPLEIYCSWKPEGEWKECEAVFEIEDYRDVRSKLSSPKIELNFADKKNVRNIEISYSSEFEVEKITSIQTSAEEKDNKVSKGRDRGIGPFSISSAITKRPVERTLEIKKKVFLKDEKLNFRKRRFTDFSEFSESAVEHDNLSLNSSTEGVPLVSVRGEISGQSLSRSYQESENNESNLETNDSDSVSARKSLESADSFSKDSKNYSENYEEESPGHSLISGFSLFSDAELSTKEPFAVRVRFEVPKYSSNQFGFRIYEGGFEASIDPDVSGCGSLDSENGVYLLEGDTEAAQTCFIVSANNITLDCQGHRINYSVSGEGYGVYSSANFTTIRNCFIADGNSTGNGSAVYLSDSENSLIENNTILTYLDYEEGVYVNGNFNNIINNNITTYGRYAYSVYLTNSFNNSVVNNSLITYFWDSYGIFLDSSLDTQINGNNITTFEAEAYGIRMYNSSYNVVSSNNITAIEELGYPLYLTSGSNYNNLSNNELAVYVKDNALIYVDSDSNYFRSNNLTSHGNVAFGIHVRPEAQNNTFQNNRVITYGNDSYAVYLESGSNNLFLDNVFVTYGYWGFVFFISGSNSNSFFNNSLFAYGMWSPCVLIEGPSDGNLFSGLRAITNNSFSEIFYAYNYDANFSVKDSYINASYPATEEVYFESSLIGNIWNFTNVTSFDSRWDIGASGELIVSNYLDIFTNYINNSVAAANIVFEDRNFNRIFSGKTNGSGGLRKIIPDYIQNSSDSVIEYSNYSLNVSLGSEKFNLSLNLSESHYLSFTFNSTLYQLYNEEVYPKISFIAPTPANATIQNNTNIFVNASISDLEANVSAFIDLDNRLVGWWRMDDINSAGEVVDYIGENNGTIVGQAYQVDTGKIGWGLEFDGTRDYVNLGNSELFNTGQNFSIAFWIKTMDISGQPTFIGRVDEGGAYITYWYIGKKAIDGKVEAGFGDGENYSIVYSNENINDNEWHQIVWIRNAGLQKIYIDGKNSTNIVRMDTGIGEINLSTNAYIGGDPEIDDYYFNGSIDDVMVFDRGLSAEEIYGLYANQSSRYLGINFTDLAEGFHIFKVYVQDYGGRVNVTEERRVLINLSYYGANLTNSTNSSIPANDNSGGGGSSNSCKPDWNCSEWGKCVDGKQMRECSNLKDNCDEQKPDIERSCKVKEVSDKIKSNQDTLFDINLRILKRNLAISEKLSSSVSLINLGIPGKVKTNLTYIISNSDGAEVYREEEIVPVETQIEFIKVMDTSELKEGDYMLYVELKYEGQTEPATAQESFTVGKASLFNAYSPYLIIVFILGLILIIWAVLRIYKKIKSRV